MLVLRRASRRGKRLGVLALFLHTSLLAATDSAWFARVWQAEEGLPDNSVTGVAQTPDGYLWVSTHSGLAQFDGVRFQMVPVPNPQGGTLPIVRALLLGRESEKWLALEGGMAACITPGHTQVFGPTAGLSSFRPLTIAQDSEGAIWMGYVDGSACRILDGQVARFTARDGLSGAGYCCVASDARGRLWFGKAGHLGIFEGGRFNTLGALPEKLVRLGTARGGGMWVCASLQLFKCGEAGSLTRRGELTPEREGTEPTVLFEDRAGSLWLGTSASGLYRFDGTNFSQVESSQGFVECITEDREGHMWVGTSGGGLRRLRSRVVEFQGAGAGLPFETPRSVCEDTKGVLWAVGQNGGLARWERDRWDVVSTNVGWSGARATCVAGDRQGVVWVGTQRGGLCRWQNGAFSVLTREQGLGGDIVRGLLPDRNGNLWISLETSTCLQRFAGGQFRTYDQPSGRHTIRAMAEDSDGRIWLGTSDGLLLRVNGDALVDETPRLLPQARPIRCLHATPDGALWIGYAGAGLGRLRQGKFSRFGTEQGLREDNICALVADGEGALWMAGDHGLFQARLDELESVAEGRASRVLSVAYGRDEGLPSLQGNYGYTPGVVRSGDGRLWFPTRTGLAVVYPRRLLPNRIPPLVNIERVRVDGRLVDVPAGATPLRLSPGHRKVEIEFTSPSFVGPENVQFRHQLQDWEGDWTEAGTQRSVSYARLPAGSYEFRVQACNSAGVWSQRGAALGLVVQPFVWQTWWFRLVTGMSLAVLLAWGVRSHELGKVRHKLRELEQRNAIERERARIARDIHDDLGAGLAQIGLLADLGASEAADSRKAEVNFSKIGARARTAVSALDEIVWAANPHNDNLPSLANYLCHLADECFESSPIRCRKEVPTGLPTILIGADLRHNLALAVKEALTNALKHSGARLVWLRLKWQTPRLEVAVEDDGVGFSEGAEGQLADGLRNQAARMKDVGGEVEIQGAPGRGARIVFHVVLRPPP